jgi:nucleotide-binding universal stress UspA family protein
LGQYTREKLINGIPAQVIAREAESQQCALVFMGSVGQSALARLFIGSVTNTVLHHVTKPTLAVVYP